MAGQAVCSMKGPEAAGQWGMGHERGSALKPGQMCCRAGWACHAMPWPCHALPRAHKASRSSCRCIMACPYPKPPSSPALQHKQCSHQDAPLGAQQLPQLVRSDDSAACRWYRCGPSQRSCRCRRRGCRWSASAWPLRPSLRRTPGRRSCSRRCGGWRRGRLALLTASGCCLGLRPQLCFRRRLPLGCFRRWACHAIQILLIHDALALLISRLCKRHGKEAQCHGTSATRPAV